MKVINEWNGCNTCDNTKALSKIKLMKSEFWLCKECKQSLKIQPIWI